MRAALFVVSSCAVLVACGGGDGGDGGSGPSGSTPTLALVDVRNNSFSPKSVSILAGGTVSFRWPTGSQQHNIFPVAPATKPSQTTTRDGPFTHDETFPTAGTYRYFCSVHGDASSGMNGTVVVQ